MGAIGAGEHQRQPGRAILQIVQRLRVGFPGIGMIDPLHDLPGRGGGAAGDRLGALRAAVDRIDLQSIGGLADEFLERRALQHPVDQLAPVVIGRGRKIRRQCAARQLSSSSGQSFLRPSWSSLVFGRKLPRGGRQAKRLFWHLFRQSRSGNRWIPSVESCASAAATLRPAMIRSGTISASGTSTKARSNSRGCGSVSSGLSILTSS